MDQALVCWNCKGKAKLVDKDGSGFCSTCKDKFDKKLPKNWAKGMFK